MLSNLLSKNDTGEYSVTLVKALGLIPAVLIGEYIRQYSVSEITGTLQNDEFLLDRNVAKTRTTISVEDQREIDDKLVEFEIISRTSSTSKSIKLNFTKIASLITGDDDKAFTALKKEFSETKTKKAEEKKVGKLEARVNQLMGFVNVSDTNLFNAYKRWISAVVFSANKKYITEGAVEDAQKKIDELTKLPDGRHNLDVALKVLDISTKYEYTNMEWAIKKYRETTNTFSVFQTGRVADANQPWLDGSTIGA